MQIICHSGPASQTLQDAMRIGRVHVYETYLKDDDTVEEDIVTNDQGSFYELIDQGFAGDQIPDDIEGIDDSDDYQEYLYKEHKMASWNHLHSIILGVDAYRIYKQQKDYLLHKIVKPFGVPVKAAFYRIEVITRYIEYFPPPSGRGKPPTQDQWESFEETKKISTKDKKEMKYNLLPESYHDRFDESENDWIEMSHSKFLSEAQKFEALDTKNVSRTRKRRKQRSAKLARTTIARRTLQGLRRVLMPVVRRGRPLMVRMSMVWLVCASYAVQQVLRTLSTSHITQISVIRRTSTLRNLVTE